MRTLRVVVVLAGLLSGLLTAAAVPASAEQVQLAVTLTDITPVLTARGTVTARGMVRNTGDLPIDLLNASLWINTHPITTRADLAEAAAEEPGDRLGVRFSSETEDVNQVAETLGPGDSAPFTASLPVKRLGLSGHGVYMVGVDIRGTPSRQARDTLGRVRSFICYPPPGGTGAVQVATVLPVTATPTLLDTSTLRDGSLAAAVQPGGRLAMTAELAGPSRAALAVDPATMAELAILARPHQEGGQQVAANDDAARVLAALTRKARNGSNTILLPYADPDIESLEHLRLVQPLADLPAVTATSAKAGGIAGQLTAWPDAGYADAAALEELALNGVGRVLLSADALPDLPPAAVSRRPTFPVRTSEGPITALVYDPALLAGGELGQNSDLMTRQRFLAETLLQAMQLKPGQTYRTIAVLPMDAQETPGLAATLTPPASARWVSAQRLSTVTAKAGRSYTGRLTYPSTRRDREFGPEVADGLRRLLDASGALQTVTSGTADGSASGGAGQRVAAIRAELAADFFAASSVGWRRDEQGARRYADTLTDGVRQRLRGVELTVPRFATLSGSSGAFPITVSNELDSPVNVIVRLTARRPGVIAQVPDERVTVDGKRKHISRVTAHASGSGVVTVEATLLAPDGTPIGPPSVFTLRVTTYGWWGWAILGAGLALFVAALLFRRHRLSRHGGSEIRDRDGDDGPVPRRGPGDRTGRASGRGDLRVHDGGAPR
jgi:hypothetical protein